MTQKNILQYFMSCFTKDFVKFYGRASRKEYWGFALISTLISISLSQVDSLFVDQLTIGGFVLSTGTPYGLISLIPSTAVAVRRFHDTEAKNWLIGVYILLCLPTVLSAFNIEYSDVFTFQSGINILLITSFTALIIYMIITLCKKGTFGLNKYGPDPLNPELGNEIDLIGAE